MKKVIHLKFKVIKLKDHPFSYKYNVQLHTNSGRNNSFVYSGFGRYCMTRKEVEAYIQKTINEYSNLFENVVVERGKYGY